MRTKYETIDGTRYVWYYYHPEKGEKRPGPPSNKWKWVGSGCWVDGECDVQYKYVGTSKRLSKKSKKTSKKKVKRCPNGSRRSGMRCVKKR